VHLEQRAYGPDSTPEECDAIADRVFLLEERVLLDNDSVRLVFVTYPPGADSDLHFNVGPEVTIVQEGELVLFAQGRREVLGPGGAHWLPDATTHLARNETDRPTRFWSLLLKRCD